MNPFAPLGSSVKVAATTASGSVALGQRARTVRVHNASAAIAFIAFGDASVTANASGSGSIPVAAGATEVFGGGSTHAAAVLSTGTGDVWFTPGDGV